MIFNDKTIFANRYKFIQRIYLSENIESWKAEDTKVKSLVTIRFSAQINSAVSNALLLKEYLLLTQIRHNRLLTPLHYDEWETIPYIVYPYTDSSELKKRIQSEQLLSESEAKSMFVALSEGLQVLHHEGVLHRNIHAGNVFMLNHEYVLGQFKRQNDFSKEQQQEVLPYSAPELFSEQPVFTDKSDIFSLSVLVYYLCTGIMPWQGMGGLALLKGAFIPNLPSVFSAEFNMLLKQCLSVKAEDRPTIEAILNTLKKENNPVNISTHNSVEAVAKTSVSVAAEPVVIANIEKEIVEKETVAVVVQQGDNKHRRNYFVPIITGVAAILLLSFFIWRYFKVNIESQNNVQLVITQKAESNKLDSKAYTDNIGTVASENNNIEIDTTMAHAEAVKQDIAVIKKKKAYLRPFVNEQGLYGYKTWGNRVKIEPVYNDVFEFSENLAAVKYKGKWGYIDTKGTIVIHPQYTKATSFKNHIATVEKDGTVFSINTNGNCVNGCVAVITQQNL